MVSLTALSRIELCKDTNTFVMPKDKIFIYKFLSKIMYKKSVLSSQTAHIEKKQ